MSIIVCDVTAININIGDYNTKVCLWLSGLYSIHSVITPRANLNILGSEKSWDNSLNRAVSETEYGCHPPKWILMKNNRPMHSDSHIISAVRICSISGDRLLKYPKASAPVVYSSATYGYFLGFSLNVRDRPITCSCVIIVSCMTDLIGYTVLFLFLFSFFFLCLF